MPSKNCTLKKHRPRLHRLTTMLLVGLFFSLSCSLSAGKLLVQAPTPTPKAKKTPQPTFTFTPAWTATFTPSPTATNTPTPTATSTPEPTATEIVEDTPPPPPVPAAPAEPTATPIPEEPTPIPTPEYPFQVVYYVHDTGALDFTRMTMWVREDYGPGFFDTQAGYQLKAVAPDGSTHLSEISGAGFGDSTVKGTGDNHNMNSKLEFAPYVPGTYLISLVQGGVQVSPEIELTLSADPQQYVHFDFFWPKEKNQ